MLLIGLLGVPQHASFGFYLQSIPKPDLHGKDIIQPESLGTDML